MRQRDSSRSSSQRRPRLLRASVTEPSIFTSSIANHGALDMSQPSANSSSVNSSSSYRRATDLLNHVAYLSSCATSPVSSFSTGAVFDRMQRRTSQSTGSSTSPGIASNSGRSHSVSHGSGSSGRSNDGSGSACRRADNEGMLGSSPASTHTSGSLVDLHSHHPCSAHYYSFPSFDTWDPDSQDKEDEVDG